jgi:hypothetical protein
MTRALFTPVIVKKHTSAFDVELATGCKAPGCFARINRWRQSDMEKLIKWLREVEHLANEICFQVATVYADDLQFKTFLEQNAEDEAWHFHVMGSAAEYFKETSAPVPAVSVDKETSDKVMAFFSDLKEQLRNKTISKDEFIEKMVQAELSEWNDIFFYVVSILKEKANEFIYPAAKIQAHVKKIVRFLEETENRPDILKKLKALPPVWTENILIVDDEEWNLNSVRPGPGVKTCIGI